jgi:hypothetical protein
MPATTILKQVIDSNTPSIQKVAVLRTSTFAEVNYGGPAPVALSPQGQQLQLAAFLGKIGASELNLAAILTGENIPALDMATGLKDITVGVVVVLAALPEGINNPNKELVGTPLMCVSTHSRTRGYGFRDALGNKHYIVSPIKNMMRPATEEETVAVVDGLLKLRPTQMVKLFSDKSSEFGED